MDDLANNWGVNFCLPEKCNRSVQPPALPRVLPLGEKENTESLSGLAAAETDRFLFERVTCSGSQANSWAIDDATNHNVSLCLFGAGGFVAGDGSAIQSHTSSQFSVGDDLALVSLPEQVSGPDCRRCTIPLPHHIPKVMDPSVLKKCEDACLRAAHIKLCSAKMNRTPCRALVLELTLAGNGATLSNRALASIGKLAKHHGLGIILDEVMTAGRTGAMPFVLSKPVSFQAAATHITLGKWCKMGMVLLSTAWSKKREKLHPLGKRGASTTLGMKEATMHWRCLKKCIHEIPQKRANTLKKLRLVESDVWGEGLLLFGPHKRTTLRGLKCRHLPLIHANTPIDNFKHSRCNSRQHRQKVNQSVVEAQMRWALDAPEHWQQFDEKHQAERLLDFELCSKLVDRHSDAEANSAADWISSCMPEGTNRSQGEAALARLRMAGYMDNTQMGMKRKRQWKLAADFMAPWKSDDFDEVLEGLPK